MKIKFILLNFVSLKKIKKKTIKINLEKSIDFF